MISIHGLFLYSKKKNAWFQEKLFFFFTAFFPIETEKGKKIMQAFLKVQTKLEFNLWENFAKLL